MAFLLYGPLCSWAERIMTKIDIAVDKVES